MCGRFSLTVNEAELNLRFEVEGGNAPYESRYNCAPTQMLAVITNEHPEILSYFRWGLIPFWAKDPSIGNKMINARAETLTEKASFRTPLKSRRCLVPADSFYEWKQDKKKIPYRILLKSQDIFAFAGLWESWNSPEGTPVHSFSIITTAANEFMKPIHERMPVILGKEEEKLWLFEKDETALLSLLKACPSDLLDAYPVSGLINSPGNDTPDVLLKAEYPETPGLF